MVKEAYRQLVPYSIRRRVDNARRWVVFRRAMHRLMEMDVDEGIPTSVLSSLIYGWGNGSWSAGPLYSRACVKTARSAKGSILECGSGLSTIILGWVASHTGNSVYALEHKEEWGSRVRSYLERYGLDRVTVIDAPLRDYGDFVWYTPPLDAMPDEFSMVVCDGPPGKIKGKRYGLLPIMKDRLSSDVVILLDDAGRTEEREVLEWWDEEQGINCSLEGGGEEQFARVRLQGINES
jgi:precorrin-6B methylase 2